MGQVIHRPENYALVNEITALRREELEQRVEKILSLREILTPEQFKKFQQKIEGCKRGRTERRKRLRKRLKEDF